MQNKRPAFRIANPTVAQVRKWLDQRRFAIPQLQREFVWNGRKAAKLFDSIYRGLTIGSVLVWETASTNSDWLRTELHLLPPFSKANDSVWYLIDGQQRLTVLYQAGLGEKKTNSSGRELDFRHITFALDPFDGDEDFFAYRHEVDGRHIPVADILSEDWDHSCRKLSAAKQKKIKECHEVLTRYRIPIQFINTKSIDDVRETFLRINSGGTRVTDADEAFSRASRFDLRAHVRTLRGSLPDMEALDANVLLRGFGFVNGKTDVHKRAIQSLVKEWDQQIRDDESHRKEFDSLWNQYSSAVAKAANFLRQEFSVYNLDFLPSENMLAVLAFFFWSNGTQPVTSQKKELRKWFWATAVWNRYSGRGHSANIKADLEYFGKLAWHKYYRFSIADKPPASEIIRTQYSVRSSFGRGFWCLLARRKPRRLLQDGEIPLAIVSGRADKHNKHHIFPRDLLIRHGFVARDYNSITNLCFLPAEENQSIGSKPPHDYLTDLRGKTGFPGKMSSHLIPHKAGSAIRLRDVKRAFRQFRRERASEIRRAFKEAAGVDLFRDER